MIKNTVAIWFIIFLAGMLTTDDSNAGRVGSGFKLGLNIATLSGEDAEASHAESIVGLVAGGYLRVKINERFALQPELLFSRNGARGDTLGFEGTVRLNYIEAPVLLRYSFETGGVVTPALFLGPALRGRLSADAEADNGAFRGLDHVVRPFDLGLVLGGDAGFKVGRPQFTIEARYIIGLTSIDDTARGAEMRNRVFSIIVGLFFGPRDER